MNLVSILQQHGFLPQEKRAVLGLGLIYMVRMLGLFMLLPVMALYAGEFAEVTPLLIGWAVGVYGLSQALLQIPFGILSDLFGRRLMITLGLLLFLAGSLIAAYADTVFLLILGRALQGAGAVAGVIMALAADLTRDSQRSKAMALIGASIGLAFIVALIIGPACYAWLGGSGLFILVALLAALAIALLWAVVPPADTSTEYPSLAVFKKEITNLRLLPLNLGIFVLHAVLTASFVVIPQLLTEQFATPVENHWLIYLVVMAVSLAIMLPCLLLAERHGRTAAVLPIAALLLALSLISIGFFQVSLWVWLLALTIYFAGFNALEALLPSLASKLTVTGTRGAIMGVYSTFQFLGAFVGGVAAGWIVQNFTSNAVFISCSVLVSIWLIIALWFSRVGLAAVRPQQQAGT